jgi:hypothetical protein
MRGSEYTQIVITKYLGLMPTAYFMRGGCGFSSCKSIDATPHMQEISPASRLLRSTPAAASPVAGSGVRLVRVWSLTISSVTLVSRSLATIAFNGKQDNR